MESIKKYYDELMELSRSEKIIKKCGENAVEFDLAATEEELVACEKKIGTKIPEDYKNWLRLTKECNIPYTSIEISFPQIIDAYYNGYLPEDYVIIGHMCGDGEVICYSKSTEEYLTFFEGEVNFQFETLGELLEFIINDLRHDVPQIHFTAEEIAEMIAISEGRMKNKWEETNN